MRDGEPITMYFKISGMAIEINNRNKQSIIIDNQFRYRINVK